MVVERPVTRLAIVEIDPFTDFVVSNRILPAVVGIDARDWIDVGLWDELDSSSRSWRPCRLWDHTTGKNAVRRRGTATEVVRLAWGYCIAQTLGKPRGPVD